MIRYSILSIFLFACESKVSQEVDSLQTDMSVSQDRYDQLEQKMNSMEAAINSLQTEVETLTTQNTEQADTIQQLNDELSQRPTVEELETWITEKNYLSAEEIADYVYVTAPSITEFDMIIDQVETNADDIANHNTSITLLQTNVSANTLAITNNTNAITANSTDIQNNSTAITANTTMIGNHETLINDNTTIINDVETNLSVVELSVTEMSDGGGIEAGTITIWSGAIEDIPEGWVLCDGSNDTPDLQDRFVIGGGANYSTNATGGSSSLSVSYSVASNQLGTCYSGYGGCPYFSYISGVSGGSSLPPYYALAYIMKSE